MKRFITSAVALSALLALSQLCGTNPAAAQDHTTAATMTLRAMVPARVVQFALAMKGRRIEPGQCTDLVIAALAHGGAKPGDFSDPKNYVWGTLKVPFRFGKTKLVSRPKPEMGDIIQFEDCYFKKPDGSQWFDMPHHTAIVMSASGTSVVLLHQNGGGNGTVREDTLDLAWKTKGTYKLYRPVPK